MKVGPTSFRTTFNVPFSTTLRGYDPAALAVVGAFTTSPSASDVANIDRLVRKLKDADIWDSLDLLYVLAAATSQAARVNWKAPGSFTASVANAPTFTAYRGYTGNGTSSRLGTGWVPSTNGVNFTQDDASIWTWIRTNAGANKSVLGSYSPEPVALINPRNAVDSLDFRLNNALTGLVAASTVNAVGFNGVQRRSSVDVRAFKDGVEVTTTPAGSLTSTGVPTVEQWILASNPAIFDARENSFIAYASGLAGKEAAFYAAVLEYMQAVGAA